MSWKIKIFDKQALTLAEFGQIMYLDSKEAYRIITDGRFIKKLKREEPAIFNEYKKIFATVEDDEQFVFLISYLFCPYMSFRYHRFRFDDLAELGQKMLMFAPQMDVYLEDILKHKMLSRLFIAQEKDQREKKRFELIKNCEKIYDDDHSLAYFKLAYGLSGSRLIYYYGRVFHDPQLFFQFVTNESIITEFSLNFEESKYLAVWLEILGYQEQLQRYENLVSYFVGKEDKK